MRIVLLLADEGFHPLPDLGDVVSLLETTLMRLPGVGELPANEMHGVQREVRTGIMFFSFRKMTGPGTGF